MTTTYSTLVVDPPWPQKGAGALVGRMGFGDATGASKPMPYPTMPIADIAALPVGDLARRDAHLYVWTTSRFMPDTYTLLKAWGFKPSTLLVWAKKPMGGGLGGAFGIATEFVIFARRGQLATSARIGRNWFEWKRPYDERGKPRHSAKPPEFFDLVETVSPGPYLELFARNNRPGWDAWGNEVDNCADLAPLGGVA